MRFTTRHGITPVARPRIVLALMAAVLTPALFHAQSVRVRQEKDSAQSVLRVTVDAEALERKIREFISSLELERAIATALHDVPRSDSRRMSALNDSVRTIARRNAELFSEIRMRCARDRGEPEGYLGISFETTQITQRDGEPRMYEFGAVETVNPGSPAEKAGIRRGDILLSVAGMDARKPMPLASVLKPGATVLVRLQRGRTPQDVKVVVEKRPQGYGSECANMDQVVSLERESPVTLFTRDAPVRAKIVARTPSMPPDPSAPFLSPAFGYAFSVARPTVIAGAQMLPLDDDAKQSLSVDNGVLVVKVLPGTPARDAGLRGLDVIISADGESVRSLGALTRIIGNAESRVVQLQVVRGGKTLAMTLRWQEQER